MEFNSVALLVSIVFPLLAGFTLLAVPKLSKPVLRLVALSSFTLPLVIAVWLYFMFFSVEPVNGYRFVTVLPVGLDRFGIFLHLGLNGISLPLFFLAGIVGLAAGLYALHSEAERKQLFLGLLLLMHGGLMGVFSSVDIFFFYFFHEVALIPTFILIGIWGGYGRRVAAMEMTIYLTLGALLSLVGLITVYAGSGASSFDMVAIREALADKPLSETVQDNAFALLLFGFGILVSLFPFHSWAPRGYGAAPTPAAMLHAGVLKKFGLYGLLQIAYPLLPSGADNWSGVLLWLALGNIIIIGIVTLAQRDLKQMIGYSSVMHMGYCFLGILCASQIGVGGAVLLMFAHGLSVALLFMLSTGIFHRVQTYDMREMGGLLRQAPILGAFFVAGTFASIGLPGFANFWGEFSIFIALWSYEPWILVPAGLGIVISAVYGLRSIAWVFFGEPTEALKERLREQAAFDIRPGERMAGSLLLAALLIVGVFPRVFTDYLNEDLEALLHLPPDNESVEVVSIRETASAQNFVELP